MKSKNKVGNREFDEKKVLHLLYQFELILLLNVLEIFVMKWD